MLLLFSKPRIVLYTFSVLCWIYVIYLVVTEFSVIHSLVNACGLDYELQLLGPVDGDKIGVTGLNRSGVVVGYVKRGEHVQGFYHDGQTLTVIPTPEGFSDLTADGINDNGLIVGTVGTATLMNIFVYDIAQTNLKIMNPFDTFHSFVSNITNMGVVIGFFKPQKPKDKKDQPNDPFHPFLMRADLKVESLQIVPTDEPGVTFTISDMNDGGQITGTITDRRGVTLPKEGVDSAYSWKDGELQIIGIGHANSINNHGTIAGYLQEAECAAIWDADGHARCILSRAGAFDINDRDEVIGNSRKHGPFYWSDQCGAIYLRQFIPRGKKWRLLSASAINNRGQISGVLYYPEGASIYNAPSPYQPYRMTIRSSVGNKRDNTRQF